MAPVLRNGVGLHVEPSPAIDTYRFGTLSGDHARTGSAVEAAGSKGACEGDARAQVVVFDKDGIRGL